MRDYPVHYLRYCFNHNYTLQPNNNPIGTMDISLCQVEIADYCINSLLKWTVSCIHQLSWLLRRKIINKWKKNFNNINKMSCSLALADIHIPKVPWIFNLYIIEVSKNFSRVLLFTKDHCTHRCNTYLKITTDLLYTFIYMSKWKLV